MRNLAEAYCKSEANLNNLTGIDHNKIIECFHPFFRELGEKFGADKWGDFINSVLDIQTK